MPFKKSITGVIIILIAIITIIGLSGLDSLFRTQINTDTAQINADKENRKNLRNNSREFVTSMEKIFLKTTDGVKISADLYSAESPHGWLVLIHMMPATKESYIELAQRFQNLGYESIAIDLRGHGGSTHIETDTQTQIDAETKLDYRNFSDKEHQESILDLEAAIDYLIKNRGAEPDKISFIGASIGANLSLQYISEHSEFKTAILFSPGLNYRGIKTELLIKNIKDGQKVFFISSQDDGENAKENQKLYDLTPIGAEKKIQIYETGGHGTDILNNQQALMSLILDFIKIKAD